MYVDIVNTDKKYSIIYADPPWSYNDKKCNGACEFHYPTMKIDDICALPIERIAEKDCVLFMWATYPMLPDALKLIDAWALNISQLRFSG